MSVLSRSWDAVESLWASPKATNLMLQELQMLLCLGPLLQTDLRCDYDGSVTCSDASETGGAAAQSVRLSWSGRSLVGSLQSSWMRPIEYPFLIISIFNGVGGAFRLYDVLWVQPLGRISVEISKDANRVTRCTWPGVEELLDIEELTSGRRAEMGKYVPTGARSAPVGRLPLCAPVQGTCLSTKPTGPRFSSILEVIGSTAMGTRSVRWPCGRAVLHRERRFHGRGGQERDQLPS